MIIYTKEQIKLVELKHHLPQMMRVIREELIEFAKGKSVVPTPFHLNVLESNGECHIKGGYNTADAFFVIKMATGFYANTKHDLPSGDGLFIVCCKQTGMIQAILCDAGYLTTLRTAVTACIVATLTPELTDKISIIGTGELAKLVIEMMHQQYPEAPISLWGRNKDKIILMQKAYPFVKYESDLTALVRKGGIVISTTASTSPLVYAQDIGEKVHLIALGADQPGKQEIDESVFSLAQQVIVDSNAQSMLFGDCAIAVKNQTIQASALVELGFVLQSTASQQAHVSITDLVGVAPQDIGIAKYMLYALSN